MSIGMHHICSVTEAQTYADMRQGMGCSMKKARQFFPDAGQLRSIGSAGCDHDLSNLRIAYGYPPGHMRRPLQSI